LRLLRRAALASLLLPVGLAADEPPIEVNPNRPTFATPARTTQAGVAELEFGLERSVPRDGGGLWFSPFLLKLGLLEHVELRIGGNGLLHRSQPGARDATGFGDTTLGAQWCFLPKGPFGVDQAVQLTWKFPTASTRKGLGDGEADGTLMLLFSRDLGPFHGDANVLASWLGRPAGDGGGSEFQPAATLSVGRTLGDRWSLTGELYWIGASFANGRIVSNLWAVAFKSSPRLVWDGGVDAGLSHGAPRVSLFAGFTTGVGRFHHPRR
jgi:hypothetical protein